MTEPGKRKIQKVTIKLPELRQPSEEPKEKELTDPPLLKKGNFKSISREEYQGDRWNKLVDIFQKTQTQFSHIYRQILTLTERQDSFNATIMEYFQQSNFSSNSAAPTSQSPSPNLEPRYRFFLVDVPIESGRKINHEKLKRWLGRVLTGTFSVAFHRYQTGEMSFEQTKIYCSTNILRNMASINEKLDLRGGDIEMMQSEMNRLLGYMQLKYPLTESTQINKGLESSVEEVDNMGLLAHNYFASSDLVFEWREDGNYNDLIMKMLNDIFSRIDSKSSSAKGSNFQDFKEFMTDLFQTVEEEQEEQSPGDPIPGVFDFITDRYVKARSVIKEQQPITGRHMKDSSKIKQEKEQYRAKVKEYTHFSIGRKVPQSFKPYSSKNIESMNLTIKSPSVLRVLTKWAEQLRKKFNTPFYFANLSDSIKCQKGGTVHSLLYPLRLILDEEIAKEQQQIQEYLKKSAKENIDLQLKLMRKQINRQDSPLQDLELENICGRYSVQVVNSLHSNLIGYLNRLIHGLTSVSKRFFERIRPAQSEWTSPPDLVTFTIGDLLRCKISSRQKQILRIYQLLKQLSLRNPDKVKIIRVKNRLTKSTNDILVNIKFNNLITSEVQLAVKTNVSHFHTCSNQFCHYLYQLERSPFGAIAELCNIWTALDRTSDAFKEQVQLEGARQTPIRAHTCQSTLQPFYHPFICYTCQVAYYHNNYLRSHGQCQNCKQIICAKCLLGKEDPSKLKSQFISNKSLRTHTKSLVERMITSLDLNRHQIPEFGLCLSIERRSPRVQIFKLITYSGQKYILGKEGGKLYEIEKVQTQKQLAKFLRGYLIFQLDQQWGEKELKITAEEGLQKYILPQTLGAVFSKSKESLVLGHQLPNEVLLQALKVNRNQNKEKVRKIFLDSNQIEEVSFIPQHFPFLVLLELSNNPIKGLDNLQFLIFLKSLSLVGCSINELPESLLKTTSLLELKLAKNKLTSIEGISRLQKLQLLDVSDNSLEVLPPEIGQLQQLVLLRMENNLLTKLASEIQHFKELRGLYLSNNRLESIPEQIGQISSLEVLDLSHNHFISVTEEIGKLFNLEQLDISFNELQHLPRAIGDLQSMKRLNVSNNEKLKSLPVQISYLSQLMALDISFCCFDQFTVQFPTLQSLNISHNRFSSLPIFQSGNLTTLNASHNKLSSEKVQDSFVKLMKLENLNLSNNSLDRLPNLLECDRLFEVNASFNKIVALSEQDVMGLNALEICNLNKNLLEQVPSGLLSLPNLKSLNLSSNRLRNLGDPQVVWPTLININLSDNKLEQLPPCLFKAPENENSRIASIDISSNQIQELPPDLVQLKYLRVLKVSRNRFKKMNNDLENFIKEKIIEIDQPGDISPYRRTFTTKKSFKN